MQFATPACRVLITAVAGHEWFTCGRPNKPFWQWTVKIWHAGKETTAEDAAALSVRAHYVSGRGYQPFYKDHPNGNIQLPCTVRQKNLVRALLQLIKLETLAMLCP